MVIQTWQEPKKGQIPDFFYFSLLQQFKEVRHGISTRHSEPQIKKQAQVRAAQPHSNKFAEVTKKHQTKIITKVDALLTKQTDLCLRIGTSDCVPIIIYNSIEKRGGVIHAGVKGTTQQILLNVIKSFKNTKNIWLGIGPAIGAECYQQIDLQLENILQAKASGVPLKQIEVMRWCTRCQNHIFFSHRAGDKYNFGTYFSLA